MFFLKISILKRGKTFGELAILRNEKRTYNVVSHTNILLLTVCRKDFLKIFIHRFYLIKYSHKQYYFFDIILIVNEVTVNLILVLL